MVSYLQSELNKRVGGADILVDELGIFALNSKPVEFKLYSDNADDLNTAAGMINSMMSEISGTKGVYTNNEVATYGYEVNMDALKLNSLGLTQAEAQNELNIALMGRTVSAYRNGSKEYNIVLDSDIDSVDRLKAFEIKSSILENKHSVSQFANVALSSDKTTISRVNGRKGRIVGCYVEADASPIDIQTELEKRVNESIDEFPQSVIIEASGKKKIFFEEVLSNIGVAALVAVAAIIIILLLQFGTIRRVLIIFISVPFGLAAGFVALYITGQPLSLFALIGAVSLLGCVLANAIVLVECISNACDEGVPLEQACKDAGNARLRPIMMSSMTTVLGLLPLALFGDTLFVPMAVLMLAGLLISMTANLVLVPMVYYLAYRHKYE
jgi:multidrug efflux pump subunit AcrB